MQTTLNFGQKPQKSDKMIEENVKVVNKPPVLLPWVEKYRPHKLKEVNSQEQVTKQLEGILETGNLPHLLLYGPPGTGKTSSILALAKQLYGPDFRQRVMELNASDDRGIQVVREKIKKFAQQVVPKVLNSEYLCPNYKIIILDEADSMTTEAQSALRRIIEDFSATTRFCIICNYITKIIEPLSSRCIKFRFQPISNESQIQTLMTICQKENIDYFLNELQDLQKLIEVSHGDLRKSVNLLQSASSLYNKQITAHNIMEISGVVPDSEIDLLFQTLSYQTPSQIIATGFSPDQIIQQFSQKILKCQIQNKQKAQLFEQIAYTDQCLNQGGDYEIQLLNLMVQCNKIMNG